MPRSHRWMGADIVAFACGIGRKIAASVDSWSSASAALWKQIAGVLNHI